MELYVYCEVLCIGQMWVVYLVFSFLIVNVKMEIVDFKTYKVSIKRIN